MLCSILHISFIMHLIIILFTNSYYFFQFLCFFHNFSCCLLSRFLSTHLRHETDDRQILEISHQTSHFMMMHIECLLLIFSTFHTNIFCEFDDNAIRNFFEQMCSYLINFTCICAKRQRNEDTTLGHVAHTTEAER